MLRWWRWSFMRKCLPGDTDNSPLGGDVRDTRWRVAFGGGAIGDLGLLLVKLEGSVDFLVDRQTGGSIWGRRR